MIITLKGATASKNLGGLNFYSILVNKSSGVTVTLNKTTVDKAAASSTTVTGTLTVAEGYTLSSVKIMMGTTDKTSAWYNASTGAITISGITGNVTITVKASSNSGSGDSGDDDTTITGYTAQPLSLNTGDWANSSVGKTGKDSVSDGSSTTRLTYNKVLTAPDSGRIKITCADNFQWGVRSGSSETLMVNNQFWLNNGDELQLATSNISGGKFMIIFRKISDVVIPPFADKADVHTTTISKSDIATMNPVLYFKDTYSADFDVSDYKLVSTLSADTSAWALATVGENGIGTDGSRTDRLSYKTVMSANDLKDDKVIMITCADGYQWGVRVSENNGTSYPQNCYWYCSGTAIRVNFAGTNPDAAIEATNYMIVFRKYKTVGGGNQSDNDQTITKDDVAIINAKVYTAKDY